MDIAMKAMMAELAPVIRDFVSESFEREAAPLKEENEALRARVATLEERQPEKGEQGERGEDGVSPEPEAIIEACKDTLGQTIKEMLDFAMSELPPPQPGPQGEKGDAGPAGNDGRDGGDGQNGKDGRGVKELLIDREGNLVAAMDDGEIKSLGPVLGKDGRDGDPGKDGRDGIDLTSFDAVVLDDDRTIELKFVSGEEERVASFKWPTMIYRDVFKDGAEYQQGDVVTWAGSLWHCNKATIAKPGTEDWTLAAKKGRDGKDGKPNG